MRTTLTMVLIVSLAALCCRTARAHGGQFSEGPPHVPNIPCDCGRVECTKCSAKDLADGGGMAERKAEVEVLERWSDVGRVRVTARFTGAAGSGRREAYLRLEQAPLFAVTAATIRQGEHVLEGALRASRRARRDYLFVRNRTLLDPLLVQREDVGAVGLRAFPIQPGETTEVVLEGYVLLETQDRDAVRIYRTGATCLVVRPLTDATRRDADFADEAGGRALRFLGERPCRRLHPDRFREAVEVPGVRALLAVVRNEGDEAVDDGTALVALQPGQVAPRDLFVGPVSQAPRVGPPPFPHPVDPVPPPPPPTPTREAPEARSDST